ncbi:MAG TPA: ATP-binding protein [Acidimicrobiia bacterium]
MPAERARAVASAIRTDWREIGGLGRLALLGLIGSLAVAVVLGFSITSGARDHLLEARAHLLAAVVSEIAAIAPAPIEAPVSPAFEELVELRLLGGETVRVKLWREDGTIVYSDSEDLMGSTFELSEPALDALAGEPSHFISDLRDPAHAGERELGQLIEFFIPFGPDGDPVGVFEIEQLPESLNESMSSIGRHVWLSIGSGIFVLGGFLVVLIISRARDLDRRRLRAERLVGAVLTAQDSERRRVVGSLHDDVGQPLYRLLYGIQGSKSKIPPDHPAALELERLAGIAMEIDETLRRELRLLHQGMEADAGLERALAQLVDLTTTESDLDIALTVDLEREPEPVPRAAIYRAMREALTNARKHSGAQRVTIEVTETAGDVIAQVTDDGRGDPIVPGLGLTTTRERLEAIGGKLEISSRRGRGTRVRARVPVERAGS